MEHITLAFKTDMFEWQEALVQIWRNVHDWSNRLTEKWFYHHILFRLWEQGTAVFFFSSLSFLKKNETHFLKMYEFIIISTHMRKTFNLN